MSITLHAAYVKIRTKHQDILGPSPTVSKLLDAPKQHRGSKLQNVNYNLRNIRQHVSNGQEGTMSMKTPAPLGLSLAEAENQRSLE